MAIQSTDAFLAEQIEQAGRQPRVTFIPEPEPEPLFCPIISVDDHCLEPPTLFAGRLPARFEDVAPRVEVSDDGTEFWIVDGERVANLQCNGVSGRPRDEWGMYAINYDQTREGVWDPKARLHEMDICGVWASLNFPSILFGFAGKRFASMRDQDLGYACLQAYNDWMIEEWVGSAKERYIACQMPWLGGGQRTVDEIYRNAERGCRSVSFSENPEGLGFASLYSGEWDPFFAACQETDTVINLHVGSSGKTHLPSAESGMAVSSALFPQSGIETVIDWIYAQIPLRFPGLKIVMSEGGVTWVPMVRERIMRTHRNVGTGINDWPRDAPDPLEFMDKNFFYTSIEDPAAFKMLDIIGVDNVMVEMDYPHYDSSWPELQAMIKYQVEHLDASVIRKVCFENAARIYRHPLPPWDMIERSEVGG